eukprot:TRINITY_DN49043_c0_g1_i1.p1 TRINITY_DN49043_c0_g1~~TRINITY_DN49043_c0_g1_i1.p1  ORF type:complete len:1629 (-),score=309.38 TRINITY_DN49043_c0_g1_i1:117-4424(-)
MLLFVFTLEACIKVGARGLLCGKLTYLRSNWNKLDFTVVICGWISLLSNQFGKCLGRGALFCATSVSSNGLRGLNSLRTVRILRPLRAAKQLPGMKALVFGLLESLPDLRDSLVLCGFVLLLFGTIGMQLYMGAFQQRCLPIDVSGGLSEASNLAAAIALASAAEGKESYKLCSMSEDSCSPGFVCRANTGINPNGGATNFDNLAFSTLSVFQAITLEGWVDIMYDVRKVRSIGHDAFFVSLILFGSLFLTNLVVAVIVKYYTAATKALEKGKPSNAMRESLCTVSEWHRQRLDHRCCRRICVEIASSPAFQFGTLGLIVLNTVVLLLENVAPDWSLELFNAIFTGIFVVEMLIKVIALGPKSYCQDSFNLFDAVVVTLSVIEIAIQQVSNERAFSATVLRTFRLLRVFKLARRMKSFRKIVETIGNSVGPTVDLGVLLLLFMFTYALIGMALFGCTEDDRGTPSATWGFEQTNKYKDRMIRPNFSTFLHSMATVFILITGENWNEVMYVAAERNGYWSSLYFVGILIVGNYIILNLSLAILVDKFDKASDMVSVSSASFCDSQGAMEDRRPQAIAVMRRATVPSARGVTPPMFNQTSLCCNGTQFKLRVSLHNIFRHTFFERFINGLIIVSAVLLALDSPSVTDPEILHVFRVMDVMLTVAFLLEAAMKIFVLGFIRGNGAYLRDPWNVLDFFVVVSSTVAIFIENEVLGLTGKASFLTWLKGLRALRALRPIRVLSRNVGLKAIVNAIMQALPAIGDVMLVLLLFLVIFSILGVQLLKNKFWTCSCQDFCPERVINPQGKLAVNATVASLCQGVCAAAVEAGERAKHGGNCVWERHNQWSFDNVALAMLTLFEVSTLEQWPDVMWNAVDGGTEDIGPQYNQNPFVVVFFIVFVFILSFFILNLFVGVIIDQFTIVRNEMNGLSSLSEHQLRWVSVQRLLLQMRPRPLIVPPNSRVRQLALQVISMREFEFTIFGFIVLNIAVLGTSHVGATAGCRKLQENANTIFMIVFLAEAALKIFALHPRLYFRDSWNTFDFVIVVGSFVDSLVNYEGDQKIDATMLRSFRIARIFRLAKSLKSLRALLDTLVSSIPDLVNVGAVLFLLFFVYAVAGMALFGDIQIEDNPGLRAMNKDVNFRSFYLAMMMLFRMSTGESWTAIMHDCFTGARCAAEPHETKCGGTGTAVVYFVSFMISGSFVSLNLFIAVLIEKTWECQEWADLESVISETAWRDNLNNFVTTWARHAPQGDSYFMPTINLPALLKEVEPPLGFNGEAFRGKSLLRVMQRLGIRDHNGRVHFAEILWRLASMVSGTDMRQVANVEVTKTLEKHVMRLMPTPNRFVDKVARLPVVYLAAEVFATVKVQSTWRAFRTQKHFMRLVAETKTKGGSDDDSAGEVEHDLGMIPHENTTMVIEEEWSPAPESRSSESLNSQTRVCL